MPTNNLANFLPQDSLKYGTLPVNARGPQCSCMESPCRCEGGLSPRSDLTPLGRLRSRRRSSQHHVSGLFREKGDEKSFLVRPYDSLDLGSSHDGDDRHDIEALQEGVEISDYQGLWYDEKKEDPLPVASYNQSTTKSTPDHLATSPRFSSVSLPPKKLISRPSPQAEFLIDGMTCSMCSQAIEKAVRALPRIESVAISLTTDTAVIAWKPADPGEEDDEPAMVQLIRDTIEAIGFDVNDVHRKVVRQDEEQAIQRGMDSPDANPARHFDSVKDRWQQIQDRQAAKVQARRRAFLFSLLGTVPILILTMLLPMVMPDHSLLSQHIMLGRRQVQVEALILWMLATPIQFISGWEFYKMAYHGIRIGRAGMDVLVVVGTSAAYAYALQGALRGDSNVAHFFETSAVLICFVLGGKWMQALAVRRTNDALTQLMELQSSTAIKVTPLQYGSLFNPLRDPYKEETVDIQEVHTGDMVKVIRGASLPADGQIVYGEMMVDESMITGESLPVYKTAGAEVLGGTICVETGTLDSQQGTAEFRESSAVGAAFVQVKGVGKDTALAQIVQLVQEAQTRTVPVQSFADDVSAVFVPTVCLIALLTFVIWYALCTTHVVPPSWYNDMGENPVSFSLLFAIACLVISCPCALGLATPTAIMVGTGVGARLGVLMKGGEALQIASKVNSVVLDKTGTLTKGRPAVTDFFRIKTHDKVSENPDLIWLLACLERTSEHPLARAVVVFAEERLSQEYLHRKPFVQPTNFRALTGRGAHCMVGGSHVAVGNRSFMDFLQVEISRPAEWCMRKLERRGKTAILAAVSGHTVAVIGIADEVKNDAADSIRYLRDVLQVDVWLVTGDNRRTAHAVAQRLGLPNNRVIAEALPSDKLHHVSVLREAGRVVAMVGDGVNDSPALAQADVGIGIGTGAQIAAEASDFVLVKGHVADVCTALHLSRVIFQRIRCNFIWSLVYNCVGIPLAAGAFYPLLRMRLPPTVAALAMVLSSVSVVVSSLMLRLYRAPQLVQKDRGQVESKQKSKVQEFCDRS